MTNAPTTIDPNEEKRILTARDGIRERLGTAVDGVPATFQQVEQVRANAAAARALGDAIAALPDGKSKAVAVTKLEEVLMWANKAVFTP